jgi:hypothetical protein
MSILASFTKVISFLQALAAEHVIRDYSLVGGLALSAWIEPRTTRDIDVVVAVASKYTFRDLQSIVEGRLGKKVHRPQMSVMTDIREMFTFVEGDIEVDIISAAGFDLALEAIQNAVSISVFDKTIKVATPEYLIALKLLPGQDQDIIDIKKLLHVADAKKTAAIAEKFMLLPRLEKILKTANNG